MDKTPETLPSSWEFPSTSSLDFSERAGKPKAQADLPESPLVFAAQVEDWQRPPHLALLDDALVDVAEGRIRRLLVEMPPRHGKSETCSRFFPAWYLGTRPRNRIILASYGADYARTWGRKAKRLLEEHGPDIFGTAVNRSSAAANDWETAAGGGMVTAGVGAGITGRGANVLLIDDPVKDQEEAGSIAIQDRNWDWYQATARTRLEPGGSIVLIQTRWHEKDLAGRILEEEGHEWTRIRLPALADGPDALGRMEGDALWPARFGAEALADIRNGRIDPATGVRRGGMSAYWWSALYQQSPSPETGNIFDRKWWRRFHPINLPANTTQGGIFVDTAQDDKEQGDYCAIATWVTSGLDFYLTRMVRAHMQFPELLQACLDARLASGGTLPLVIEETPWAKPLIHSLQRLVPGVVPFKIEGRSKIARAQAATPYAEAGNLYLPVNEPWVGDFIEELAAFPNGSHDDMVDTTSMAMLWFSARQLPPQNPRGVQVQYSPPKPGYRRDLGSGRI